jgi:hypothetical protein
MIKKKVVEEIDALTDDIVSFSYDLEEDENWRERADELRSKALQINALVRENK